MRILMQAPERLFFFVGCGLDCRPARSHGRNQELPTMTDPVVIETGANPVGSVLWLHGLGADGHDFEPIVPELRLPPELPLRFVFPHAPVRPVTINGGMAMRAWYDIVSFDTDGRADETGLLESARTLDAMIDAEIERGIPAGKIVVAGFSQGGAVAMHAGLRRTDALAGLLLLSTYLALPQRFADEVAQPQSVPIFMAHGLMDPVLPIALGKGSADALRNAGYSVDWHEYPMAHGVCPQEIEDIRRFFLGAYAS